MGRDQNKKLKNLIGALKDKASIIKATFSIHRRSSSIKLAVVRATTHGARNPPSDGRVAAVLALGNDFRPSTAFACIESLMQRLHTTSSAAVAMKSLFTLHIIVIRGPFNLRDQVAFSPFYGGRNFLNLSAFRDVSDSEMNDLSSWVRWYAGVVEHNVIVERRLDRILYFRSRNCEIEIKEGVKIDLSGELEVLVGFVERVSEVPESLHLQRKDLVYEVVRLVMENYRLVQREIWVRVKEIGDRVESLSLDELTQLVGILNRLENCRGNLNVLFVNRGKNDELWELVKKTKGKVMDRKGMKEEKRMMIARADSVESTRFWNPFVEPGQLLWVPAVDGQLGPRLLPLTVSTVG